MGWGSCSQLQFSNQFGMGARAADEPTEFNGAEVLAEGD